MGGLNWREEGVEEGGYKGDYQERLQASAVIPNAKSGFH